MKYTATNVEGSPSQNWYCSLRLSINHFLFSELGNGEDTGLMRCGQEPIPSPPIFLFNIFFPSSFSLVYSFSRAPPAGFSVLFSVPVGIKSIRMRLFLLTPHTSSHTLTPFNPPPPPNPFTFKGLNSPFSGLSTFSGPGLRKIKKKVCTSFVRCRHLSPRPVVARVV